jgi:hypothetical protein
MSPSDSSTRAPDHVGIEATTGDILDARTDTVGVGTNGFATQTGSPRTVNIFASNLVLRAGDDIGTVGNAVDTTVNTLTAIAGSDLYVYESDALTIGSISAFDANRVNLNSTTTPITTAALAGVTATAGHAKIETVNGSITVNSAVAAGLNGMLNAGTATSDVNLNATVTSNAGSVSVTAQDSVNQNANGNISVTGGTGTIYVRGVDGSITMLDGTSSTTANGNVRYHANQNVTVGLIKRRHWKRRHRCDHR